MTNKLALLIILLITGTLQANASMPADLYREPFRPQYHFTPLQQWMNDPNGMVYYQGEYHLFYQYYPHGNTWGPMHWGHAVSRDLVHWEHLPIALFPDRHGMIFSGSAVVDWQNTSGFGSDGEPPLVAIYTYHDSLGKNLGRTDFQSQAIAYSSDRGRSWTKYADNPVLENQGDADFRDPKVFWYAPTSRWIMALAVRNRVSFYSSPNLKDWTFESDFGEQWGSHAGVWECPDLFALPITGEAQSKYVLVTSVLPGGPNGGSATQYFVGEFDGKQFTLDEDLQSTLQVIPGKNRALWLDFGTDNYAGVTWSGLPGEPARRVFIGWMSNWLYATEVPTERWRSAMTLPRALSLHRTALGLRLHASPVGELEALRTASRSLEDMRVEQALDLSAELGGKPGQMEIEITMDTRDSEAVRLRLSNSDDERLDFTIDRNRRVYTLDRTAAGRSGFSESFATVQAAPIAGSLDELSLRLFLDQSSVEIFINEGETVMTALVFPNSPYSQVTLTSDGPVNIRRASIHELKSIWFPDAQQVVGNSDR